MLRKSRSYLLFAQIYLSPLLSACGASNAIDTQAALGKVVVYRNGVAYFERRASVRDGQLKLTVPAARVDDFLKSLKVVDAETHESLPVSFDTMRASTGATEMIVTVPGNRARELLISYVTDSPAWKPSYRVVLGQKPGEAELEAWAVVDNVSGEDWRDVTVGVGSTSALSFRYDLHSVRVVEREALGDERAFAAAGPMGGSPYAVAAEERPVMAAVDGRALDALLGEGAAPVPMAAPAAEAAFGMLASSRGAGAGTRTKRGRPAKNAAAESETPPAPADAFAQLADRLKAEEGGVVLQGYARSADRDPQAAALQRASIVRNELIRRGVPAEKLQAAASGLVSDSQAVRVVAGGIEGKTQQTRADADDGRAPQGSAYFVSKVPMTIEKDRSAMVSLLKHSAKAERVYYYDPVSPRGSSAYAFQAVRFDNPSDQTLDRGPFTVYSQGQFLGEGLSDAIPPHSHAFVPYALDRQVLVESRSENFEEIHRLLAVERGLAHAEVHGVVRTTLALRNRSAASAKVYVRHALAPGWELRMQGRAVERLGSDYLFPVEVAAHGEAELVIEESQPNEHAIDLRSPAGADAVAVWLQHATHIAPDLRTQLDAVLGLHRSMRELQERKSTLEEQMTEYGKRQYELNDQLVSLRKVKSAEQLSQHLAKKLREVSERAQQATMRMTDLQEQLMTSHIQLEDQLSDLRVVRAETDALPIAVR
jgi:hypothetical protein